MTAAGSHFAGEARRIVIAGDHNGVSMKAELAGWLRQAGHLVEDLGAHAADVVVDYPPLCAQLCRLVVDGGADFGIVIGGSGSGEAIACNKVRGVRAALCDSLFVTEIARGNNDANVMVMGAKVVTPTIARDLVSRWLVTGFRGGRHADRVAQIAAMERGEDLRPG